MRKDKVTGMARTIRAAAHNARAMRITLKLFATLTDYLPAHARVGNQMELEVAETDTILDILAPFALPPQLVHLVLVNGHYIAPEVRGSTCLKEADALAIWPPIAGG